MQNAKSICGLAESPVLCWKQSCRSLYFLLVLSILKLRGEQMSSVVHRSRAVLPLLVLLASIFGHESKERKRVAAGTYISELQYMNQTRKT
jgi:hypothetical protein